MKYTKEEITQRLQAYPQMIKKLKLLQYELSHTPRVTADEVLEAQAFGRAGGDIPVKGSGLNLDKTLGLALSYQEEAKRLNQEAVSYCFLIKFFNQEIRMLRMLASRIRALRSIIRT